ncbi:MAG: hypothetical protein ABIJ46_00135 [bacterium]
MTPEKESTFRQLAGSLASAKDRSLDGLTEKLLDVSGAEQWYAVRKKIIDRLRGKLDDERNVRRTREAIGNN